MPVVVLTGLRQAGKSTFLQNEPGIRDRVYRSLDDLEQLSAARADPKGFVRGSDALTIDEAQRCPDLLLAVKQEVDRDRRPGRFLLSGSADESLSRSVEESLAGRAIHRRMHPMSRREIAGDAGSRPQLARLLAGEAPSPGPASAITVDEVMRGGLPPVCLGTAPRGDLWFEGYEQTYLERDLRQMSRVADFLAFRALLRLCALRTASVLSVSEIGRAAKLTAVTAGRYLGLLEASFVIRRLPPFLGNRATRLIKSPKLFVADSGLAAHLSGASDRQDPLWGALLETWVHQNLASIVESEGCGSRLAFWHVQGRHEVDFVVESGRDCVAIEVKSAARWDERDLGPLRTFLDHTPRCKAAVLAHGGTETVSLGERLWAMPIAVLVS